MFDGRSIDGLLPDGLPGAGLLADGLDGFLSAGLMSGLGLFSGFAAGVSGLDCGLADGLDG